MSHVAVLKARAIYRQRNVVERAINRLKQFRRIATRY
jgi:transposase